MRARILTSLAGALFLLGVVGVTRADVAATQLHTTGLMLMKSCPAEPVAAGSSFHCSFVLTNLDPDHGVSDLLVTKQGLFPSNAGKGAATPISCLQGGLPVTALGKAGTATATCSNPAIQEKAPTCSSKGSKFILDEISASGVDAAFPALPVSQTASGKVTIRACPPASTNTTANKPAAPKNRPTSSSLRACGFLLIDEDSIGGDDPTNSLSASAVNDEVGAAALRARLPIFTAVGATIDLWTGTVGDEGWFAPRFIPQSWASAGPTGDGLRNFLTSALGEIRDVVPLRAEGLEMLEGSCICAVVYDSDIRVTDGPLNGSLKGANLGIAAFAVLEVNQLFGQSSGSLPRVTIRILDSDQVCRSPLRSFTDVPEPVSSSIPFDGVP